MFCKKGVLRNFIKFTGKHTCQSLFFNKVVAAALLKKRLWHRSFPVNFAKFLRTPFFHRSPLMVASVNIYYEIYHIAVLKTWGKTAVAAQATPHQEAVVRRYSSK